MGKGSLYILECEDGSYYIGSTSDVQRRYLQHVKGRGADYTKSHKPLRVAYTEEHATIGEAFKREKQLQKWSHAKKAALIA